MQNNVLNRFQLSDAVISCERYGNGHINETYLVVTESGKRYILQKINNYIFKDVPALMANIAAVTEFLSKEDPDPRHVLRLVKTIDGENFLTDESGYWRVYDYVEDSVCLDKVETAEDFYQSAVAFGEFQKKLASFPAETLTETIPHFHDTPDRFRQLHEAIENDKCGRKAEVEAEIAFWLEREEEAGMNMRLLAEGKLPLRVTHNDTKLNNVMLDAETRKPLCVIDLDTVMPGLAVNDFGDSIRFGASTAKEDETDLDKVEMSLDLFRIYAKGFLSACGDRLTKTEIAQLPMGAKLMTLECGIRFLTDYLNGDVYFHISRPKHNLDRCRTQLKLVADMEKKWSEMQKIIEEEA